MQRITNPHAHGFYGDMMERSSALHACFITLYLTQFKVLKNQGDALNSRFGRMFAKGTP